MKYAKEKKRTTDVRKTNWLTTPLWFQPILTDPAFDSVHTKLIRTFFLFIIYNWPKNNRKYTVIITFHYVICFLHYRSRSYNKKGFTIGQSLSTWIAAAGKYVNSLTATIAPYKQHIRKLFSFEVDEYSAIAAFLCIYLCMDRCQKWTWRSTFCIYFLPFSFSSSIVHCIIALCHCWLEEKQNENINSCTKTFICMYTI
jgi:hypothetical protein